MALKDYTKKLSRKAKYLIGCSIAYLLLIVLLCQFMKYDNALTLAQVLYVLMIAAGLFYKPLRREIFSSDTDQEIKEYFDKPDNAVQVATEQHLNSIFGARPADAVVPPSEPHGEGGTGPVPDSADRR